MGKAEALERTNAISRLTTFIEEAIASINQNLMDAAAQGMQTSKEETLPARSGLEDVQKMMSRLSETQAEQEDRIRGLVQKVEEVSGSQAILDRDQKAAFQELSTSITDMNIRLGGRTSGLVEDLKSLQEDVMEFRTTLTTLGTPPSLSRDHAIPNAAEFGRKLREVAEAPMRTLASDQPGGPYQTSSTLTTMEGTTPLPSQVHSEKFPRHTRMQAHGQMRVASITTPQRPNHLSPSSSWSHLAPFQMAGTVSFPVANWNPYVHAEQQEIHRVIGHPRPERANNWQETPTRSMSGAFTSPPLSARLPPRAETTAPSTGASSTPTGTGQVIRPVRLSYPWPPPAAN